MRLSVKITLLLFAVIALFIVLISGFFYSQINRNFTRQAENLMLQNSILIEQRIEFLKENLQTEMDQLASALFTENETTLAAMLADPPDFNTEVVGFAEKLRRRTTLNFLSILSPEGTILSDSLRPATFGKKDARSPFPPEQVSYVFDESARVQLQKNVTFGRYTLHLRGGYFLKQKLQKFPATGIQMELIEIGKEESAVFKTHTDTSQMTRVMELKDDLGKPVLRIRAVVSRQQLEDQKRNLIRNSSAFIVGVLAICLLTGYLFSLSISRPVARLRDAAREMSQGRLDVRVEEKGSGEIAGLMQAFNQMAQQLEENQKRLLQTERIAAWQEIARHLAHEIKNPLTPIRTSIANLRLSMEKAPEKFAEIFLESSESILEEVEKLRHLADEFSRFARFPAPTMKEGNLNEVVQKSILLYAGVPAVAIRFEPGAVHRFSFDPEQISEVVHNLLQNAVDAVGPGGMIKVSTGMLRQEERFWVYLIVEDNGKGMDEQTRRQIFTPYFTTKEKGTGIGLAIVHRIVSEHNGSIFIESEPEKGTKFEIRLPTA